MKITKAKIKRVLINEYGWHLSDSPANDELIKDIMKVINDILVSQGQKQFIK